ncbi:peptidase M13 [Massilia sp. Root133]|uniref:M13 family peptidase n=1 Tax=Massilia cellulosiltytica TaxID=2683234 RepID=A0A7X3K656_9BURK|nr:MULTISPECIES: M13-type metalloendopeptidase [Telluria group]KQY00399.1 peptidase M13 [Massilia sp. Root133]MVW58910.1 M13 family peptidase [Telluria cellulosilytica]
MKKHTLLSALTLALLANASHAAEGAAAKNTAMKKGQTLAAGVATEYIDPAVRPQDDFYEYLNGKWMKTVEIPADKSSWGSFAKLRDDTLPQLRGIIEKAAAGNPAKGTDAQRIGDYYASFMDEAKLEQLGITPLNGELAKIAALKDKSELPALLAHLGKIGVNVPYDFGIHQDNKDSTKYVADIYQSGLGMPDRDYYLKADDAKLADAKAKYLTHVEKTLALAGDKNAAANAKAIVDFETELAKVQWTKVELRDPIKAYNKVPLADMGKVAPDYDWNGYLQATGIAGKTTYVIVSQPTYLKGFAEISNKTSLDTWKAYLTMHLVDAYASYLNKAFVDERFDFYGKTLSGVKEMEPRWKRGVGAIERSQGESLGKLYVAEYFPPERKARMEALVKNLLVAYKQSIDKLDWMSPATKKEAQAKLAKFTPKIGYPNKWKDYSALVVSRDDLVGNVMRSRDVEYNRELNKLGKPIDRDEWGMTPQTINAYYNPEMNEIVFPAAILQPPFFDAKADDAVNYGGIGAVIGHEISHGFDDQGAQYDGDGNLRDWWTAADHKNFEAKTKMLVNQYNQFEPIKGYHVNGELTLGENIADNSGLAIAYKAYKISLKGKKAPVIDGLSGEQRLYMGWAQVWRTKMREQQQIVQVKTDPHSPGQFRANGTLRNQPGFYDAFKVKQGDKMYLAPQERVIIW